jgi:4-amino-4-deoxy-L-arabinose transferase-like glycosyltransferase
MRSINKPILLFCLFLLAFLLRFYRLGEIPNGLYQDETAIGYNAYSILKTARDEHGQFLPVYFKSFGDYKLPVYVYLTTLSVAVFGLTEFAVRFPAALFGSLSVIIFYFFLRRLTGNYSLSLIGLVLLALNPWHLHYSRATFEVSIGLFLLLAGGFFLLESIIQKRAVFFVLGTVIFILNMYTYNLTRVLSPILYGVFLFVLRRKLKAVPYIAFPFTVVISAVFLLPFLLTLFSAGGMRSASGTLIWSSAAVQAPLLELRSFYFYLPQFFTKLFFNQPLLTLWTYLINVASYLSVPFFFLSGSTHGNHGIGNVGQFYLVELPFFIAGVIFALRQRLPGTRLMLFLGVGTILVAALTRESPHATRSFFLIPSIIYFIAVGICFFFSVLEKRKHKIFLGGMVVVLFSYNIVYYLTSYYVRFPVLYAPQWRSVEKEIALYLKEVDGKYDHIVIDRDAGPIYTSILFYTQYPPDDFQKTARFDPDDSEGFSKIKEFGKYSFRKINWEEEKSNKTLYVTSYARKPQGFATVNIFFYPTRPVGIAIGQTIANYSVKEAAYVAVQKVE